jgi:hypothetical protein
VRRLLRLLVGAVVAIWLLGQFARGVQWVYENYARQSEPGLLRLLEYLFREEEEPEPPARAPATHVGIASDRRVSGPSRPPRE